MNVADCKAKCDTTPSCVGFEWSNIDKFCLLQRDRPAANAQPYGDQINCYKPNPTLTCTPKPCPA